MAVEIGTESCPVASCGALKAATVFGALEVVLFVVSMILTVMVVFDGGRKRIRETAISPSVAV